MTAPVRNGIERFHRVPKNASGSLVRSMFTATGTDLIVFDVKGTTILDRDLRLPAGKRVIVEPGVTLKMATSGAQFAYDKPVVGSGGSDIVKSAMIYVDEDDTTLEIYGTLDPSYSENYVEVAPGVMRQIMPIAVWRADRVRVTGDWTVVGSRAGINLTDCDDCVVEGMRYLEPDEGPGGIMAEQTSGVAMEGCRRTQIRRCLIANCYEGVDNNAYSHNTTIENCTFEAIHQIEENDNHGTIIRGCHFIDPSLLWYGDLAGPRFTERTAPTNPFRLTIEDTTVDFSAVPTEHLIQARSSFNVNGLRIRNLQVRCSASGTLSNNLLYAESTWSNVDTEIDFDAPLVVLGAALVNFAGEANHTRTKITARVSQIGGDTNKAVVKFAGAGINHTIEPTIVCSGVGRGVVVDLGPSLGGPVVIKEPYIDASGSPDAHFGITHSGTHHAIYVTGAGERAWEYLTQFDPVLFVESERRYDATGRRHFPTVVGTIATENGAFAWMPRVKGFRLDSNAELLNFGTHADYDMGSSDFTWLVWLLASPSAAVASTNYRVLNKDSSTNTGGRVYLMVRTSSGGVQQVDASIRDGSGNEARFNAVSATWANDTYRMLAIVRSGSSFRFNVAGTELTPQNAASVGSVDNAIPLLIGGQSDGSGGYVSAAAIGGAAGGGVLLSAPTLIKGYAMTAAELSQLNSYARDI